MKFLNDIRLLLLGLWLGGSVFFIAVAQVAFSILPERELAGAIVGIAMAAWFEVAEDLVDHMDQGRLATFADKFERGLALLEAGLPV